LELNEPALKGHQKHSHCRIGTTLRPCCQFASWWKQNTFDALTESEWNCSIHSGKWRDFCWECCNTEIAIWNYRWIKWLLSWRPKSAAQDRYGFGLQRNYIEANSDINIINSLNQDIEWRVISELTKLSETRSSWEQSPWRVLILRKYLKE